MKWEHACRHDTVTLSLAVRVPGGRARDRRRPPTPPGTPAMPTTALLAVGVVGRGSTALAMAVGNKIGLRLLNSLFPALMGQRAPESLASRVGTVAFLGFNRMMSLGALAMGLLAATLNARNTAVLVGVTAACAGLAGLLVPGVRRLRNDPLNESGNIVGDSWSAAVPRTS